ncbi:MAG: Ppx/GppA family phosphatase [Pseudobdellovibrionaceae bacterium]
MKVAAIDLGTNSFLCLIAEVENGRILSVIDDHAKVVRLGQGVHQSRAFHPDALQRADVCLGEFRKTIDKYGVKKVRAVATSAARDAKNGSEFFAICERYKIDVNVISGEEEARISFCGAISGLSESLEPRVVLDIGGGSTEIIKGQGRKVLDSESLDVGCVRLTELFHAQDKLSEKDLQDMIAFAEKTISPLASRMKEPNLEVIAVAGTPTALAAMEIGMWDEKQVDGYQFSIEKLKEWMEKLSFISKEERVKKYGIEAGRADIIPAGCVLLWVSAKELGVSKISTSTRGVRYGLAETLA